MNKQGGEKLLSVWWFFVLMVIGGGIVIGVTIFYAGDYNVNKIEADILSERVVDCLVDNGYLQYKEIDFDKCNLKQELFEEGSNFFIRVNITGEAVRYGDFSLEKACEVGERVEGRYFPKCSWKKIPVLYKENNEIKNLRLEILTASNQIGKKIPAV